MALRLVEIVVPAGRTDDALETIHDEAGEHHRGLWRLPLQDDRTLIRLLLDAERCESLLDSLGRRHDDDDGFRITLLPVEATVPRPEDHDEEEAEAAGDGAVNGKGDDEDSRTPGRVSREELYADVEETVGVGWLYVVLVALSTVVATVGLVRGSVAVIIGAMVIAPLLGPNVGLALATTLGDLPLARRALHANGLGVLVCLLLSAGLGLVLPVEPALPEIASRTQLGFGDLALALAAGAAGVLTFTSGVSTALVGVMVAVALLPPLATGGLLLGAGYLQGAQGALLLVVANVICVNLAGVLTFLIQGIQPMNWWDAERARSATYQALAIWVVLLGVLLVTLLV